MQIRPKKSLGQHFLKSEKALKQIIKASNIQEGDLVLEIGPGTGILTREILKCGAKVIAIEKDNRAEEILKINFQKELDSGQLKIIREDVLNIDPNSMGLINCKYSIVANIPYYITGAILEKFLEFDPRPNKMVLLVQKEVAERIVTKDSKESVLSISVKAFGEPKIIDTVPRGAFVPPPNVDSAILLIDKISNTKLATNNIDIGFFFRVVKTGFLHKRKYLTSNLGEIVDKEKINTVWKIHNFDPKIRPENVNIENWINIVKDLNKAVL